MKPEDINNDNPSAPNWENYVRRLYINDAEKNIFKKYKKLQEELKNADNVKKNEIEAQINKAFPEDEWWGKYVKELYKKQEGRIYRPTRDNVRIGISRAINFFEKLEKK